MSTSPDIAAIKSAYKLSEEQARALALPSNQALVVEQTFAASVLAVVAGDRLGTLVQASGFKAFRDKFLESAGNPEDPFEVLMMEELLWSHHRVGSLHSQAAAVQSPEVAALYTVAAAKLMAENRKTVMALREYRSANVKQKDADPSGLQKKLRDTELGSNGGHPNHADDDNLATSKNCGEAKSSQTKGPDPRRPAEAA